MLENPNFHRLMPIMTIADHILAQFDLGVAYEDQDIH